MNRFKTEQLAAVSAQLQMLQENANILIAVGRPGDKPHENALALTPILIANAKTLFREVELERTLEQLELAETHLNDLGHINASSFESELRRISETLIVELKSRKFLFVAADRTKYFENQELFGKRVADRFPLANPSITEAGNCLAAECTTASVFHLMLAFEWALRTLCADLGMRRLRDWNKKENRFQYTPTSFAIWEKIINQLPGRFSKRIQKLRPGVKKQRLQEYYNSAHEDIKAVKEAWRNHVMHTRAEFDRDAAMDVFNHVKSIMTRLAK